jgi:phosphatidylserine/phosphatidylglycerophosphate/cardiolipin synthase-like enzyme
LDSEVPGQVLGILYGAREYACLVTPYVKLWGHAQQAIRDALRRQIKLYLVVRKNAEERFDDQVAWLVQSGAVVYALDNLHAKIYLNETRVLVSSMNLTESSSKNSFEIATPVADTAAARMVREYVSKRLIQNATRVKDYADLRPHAPPALGLPPGLGVCIRCGDYIPQDRFRPLCNGCYFWWSVWQNPDYEERFCHTCGRETSVNYGRPLCGVCFSQGRGGW